MITDSMTADLQSKGYTPFDYSQEMEMNLDMDQGPETLDQISLIKVPYTYRQAGQDPRTGENTTQVRTGMLVITKDGRYFLHPGIQYNAIDDTLVAAGKMFGGKTKEVDAELAERVLEQHGLSQQQTERAKASFRQGINPFIGRKTSFEESDLLDEEFLEQRRRTEQAIGSGLETEGSARRQSELLGDQKIFDPFLDQREVFKRQQGDPRSQLQQQLDIERDIIPTQELQDFISGAVRSQEQTRQTVGDPDVERMRQIQETMDFFNQQQRLKEQPDMILPQGVDARAQIMEDADRRLAERQQAELEAKRAEEQQFLENMPDVIAATQRMRQAQEQIEQDRMEREIPIEAVEPQPSPPIPPPPPPMAQTGPRYTSGEIPTGLGQQGVRVITDDIYEYRVDAENNPVGLYNTQTQRNLAISDDAAQVIRNKAQQQQMEAQQQEMDLQARMLQPSGQQDPSTSAFNPLAPSAPSAPSARFDPESQVVDYGDPIEIKEPRKLTESQKTGLIFAGLAGLDIGLEAAKALGPARREARQQIRELETLREQGRLGEDRAEDAETMRLMTRPIRAIAEQQERERQAVMAGMGQTRSAGDLARLRRERDELIDQSLARAGAQVSAQRMQRAEQDLQKLQQLQQYRQTNIEATADRLGQTAGMIAQGIGQSRAAQADMESPEEFVRNYSADLLKYGGAQTEPEAKRLAYEKYYDDQKRKNQDEYTNLFTGFKSRR